jgi:hypothetical protein
MKNWNRIVCMSLIGMGAMLADQWTGWITDEHCAKDPDGNFVGESHKKCVEKGARLVFVKECDKTIHLLSASDQSEQIMDSVGQKTTIDGRTHDDGSIEVVSIIQVTLL